MVCFRRFATLLAGTNYIACTKGNLQKDILLGAAPNPVSG
jgi:hypothetical protein